MSLVTAILPVHRYHPDFLRRAVASMWAQDSPDWRLLVVVEAGGREEVATVLGDVVADARVAIAVNKGRRLAGAINTGMEVASTPFVALLLGDDMWAPEAVRVLADHIRTHPAIDFFHSARVVVDRNDVPVGAVAASRERFEIADFRLGSPVKHLLCWRREMGLAVGGLDESLRAIGVDDYDFPWMMAEAGASFRAIDVCLYQYRNHHDAFRLTTHTPLTQHLADINAILRKHRVGRATRWRILSRRWRNGSLGDQCRYLSSFDRWRQGGS